MAVFSREDASCTSLLPAVWPLRMRVNRSAMGSVMLMRRPSPARLGETGNLTTTGDLADLHPREAELAVHAARASGNGAAVALPRRTGIARLRLQLHLRRQALFGLRISSLSLARFTAYFFTIPARRFSRSTMLVFAIDFWVPVTSGTGS